jgi:DNA polymerase III subunit beta
LSTAIATTAPDLTIERKALRNALQIVGRVAANRTTLPILKTILIQTKGDEVSFTATDLDMWISVTASANVWSDGSTAVPAKLLKDLVDKQSAPDVSIKPGKQDFSVVVSANGSKGNILCLDPDGFPGLESGDMVGRFEMEAGPLADCLSRSLWAAAADESRAILCAVYVSAETNYIDFVATDTHIMGHSRYRVQSENEYPFCAMIPSEAVKTVIAALSARKDDEAVTVVFTGPRVSFSVGNLLLSCRLIDGQYCRWQRVIPVDFPGLYTVDRDDLVAAVDRASIFADFQFGRLTFEYDPVAGEIVITAADAQAGTTEERIKADVTGKPPAKWSLAEQIFKKTLGSLPSGKITISNNRSTGPWVFHPEGNPDYTAMNMPLGDAKADEGKTDGQNADD